MGIFHNNKQNTQSDVPSDEAAAAAEHFFDEVFREELRNRGRWYFEKVINENAALFKKDLDTTVSQINTDLKDHITKQLEVAIAQVNTDLKELATKQLDNQFADYTKAMKSAQDITLQSLTKSARELQDQYQQLHKTLQESIDSQKTILGNVLEENKARLTAMRSAQDATMESLAHSTQTLQAQQKDIETALQKNVLAAQQEILVKAFEGNMSRIVEHYLLGALGDKFDLKSQLPAIIKQMEENKQAIADDMKL